MKKLIMLIVSVLILLVGCSKMTLKDFSNESSSDIKRIRFKDTVEIKDLRKLDGKKIKIIGFMANSSPLDKSMIYLMNLPYHNCVYCVPNTNKLINTMAVYPKQGENIEFTEVPIEVVGTLKFENITDETGYSYEYRLVDSEIKPADIKSMDESVKIYTDLVNKGFVTKINKIISEANSIIYYDKQWGSLADVEPIPEEYIKEVENMFEVVDKAKYQDIISVVEKLKKLVKNINDILKSKEYYKMEQLENRDYEIFYKVNDWLMKVEM